MADTDISSDEASIKKTVSLIPTPFEQWASSRGYDLTPPVALPDRKYNDPLTERVHDPYGEGRDPQRSRPQDLGRAAGLHALAHFLQQQRYHRIASL
jgi:hypothetical protein